MTSEVKQCLLNLFPVCCVMLSYYFTPERSAYYACYAWCPGQESWARLYQDPTLSARPACALWPGPPAGSKYVVDSVLSPPSCFLSAEVLVGNINCRWFLNSFSCVKGQFRHFNIVWKWLIRTTILTWTYFWLADGDKTVLWFVNDASKWWILIKCVNIILSMTFHRCNQASISA